MQNREYCLPGYFSAACGEGHTAGVRDPQAVFPRVPYVVQWLFTEGLDKIVNY